MDHFTTEQEAFWAGEFGSDYIRRNSPHSQVLSNIAFFSRILGKTVAVRSVLELGSNIGLNLEAIHTVLPQVELSAVEINPDAFARLERLPFVTAFQSSILDWTSERTYDFVFTAGVLIHIDPDHLSSVYDTMYRSSSKYVLIAEYYNPIPLEVTYRGHAGRLFKRDFAGEFLDRFADVELVDYGFVWRRDPNFPRDDTTWFLLRKTPA